MATMHTPGLVLTDHTLSLPIDYANPGAGSIDVYAREVATPEGRGKPILVFLQGGPGQESPRPMVEPANPAWLARALVDYRVLMLDQRGTGRSTPFGAASSMRAQGQADYLTHFRADSIVADAESFRRHLEATKWSVLGQSFGGFCALHYLSVAPDSLAEVFFTGGLSPVGRPVDEVYAATYKRTRKRNDDYWALFPDDRARLEHTLDLCDAGEIHLPNGDAVTSRLLRTVGINLGIAGGATQIHFLLERDPRSPAFAYDLAGLLPFNGRNPLYAVIHESSYTDGGKTRWSAQRMLPDDFVADRTLFTAEHLYGWHFDDCSDLAPFSEVASILAEHKWPALYDHDVLASVDVPCAAVIFSEDPFVDLDFSLETASLIPKMRTWVTGEHEHNALRAAGGVILDRLFTEVRR